MNKMCDLQRTKQTTKKHKYQRIIILVICVSCKEQIRTQQKKRK